MFNKYQQLLKTDNVNYEAILSKDIGLHVNGRNHASGIEAVKKYYHNLRASLSERSLSDIEIIVDSSSHLHFTWVLHGRHTGVYLEFMPTKRMLTYSEMSTLHFLNDKIIKIELFYDQKTIEEQICANSGHALSPKDIFNNLNGPAQKIFQLLLSTRQQLTDSKQALVNALRKTILIAPDLKLLNHDVISELQLKTTLTKTYFHMGDQNTEVFIYAPDEEQTNPNLPVILYLHGGGWCIGSPESYDIANRKLALATNSRVICPRYRLCPEYPFPAGFDDCCAVYWYTRNLPINNPYYINPERIIVAGDSVGGGFSAALSLRMKDEQKKQPDALMLLSPATDMRLENYSSYNQYTHNNIMIDQAIIGFIRGCYIQGDKWDHPYVSPMRGDLSAFPKTLIMIGEEDPLIDENKTFAKKIMQQSQNGCEILIGKGMPHHYHTFVGLADAVEEAYEQMSYFVQNLSKGGAME